MSEERILQIGGVTASFFGSTDALRVRAGTDTAWKWRTPTDEEYHAMLHAVENAAELTRLQQSNDALVEACRPLAELPVGAELMINDESLDTVLYKNGGKSITARDILNARTAIA